MAKDIGIVTPEGTKDISLITVGDKIIGKNGAENSLTTIGKRVLDKQWFTDQGQAFQWYIINDIYELFGTQSVLLNSGGYSCCHVSELEVGWELINENGLAVPIVSIKQSQSEEPFIKLDISGDHSYVSDGLLLHNASRYWVGGGSSANWNATVNTNWSATSGGANNASVPVSTDDVIFDAAGNSASTISATITVLSFTVVSGYTSTITHNAVLTVAGNVTLVTGYTIAGSSGMTISATSTMTSGGKTWPNGMTFSGTSTTKTLADNWVISGTLTWSNAFIVINSTTSETFSCNGFSAGATNATGTAKLILTGGTWSGGNPILNDLDIAGNVTVSGGVAFNTKTLTYVSGTVTTTGSTLTIGASTTLNTAGITWNNISMTAVTTLTLNSLFSVSGTFTCVTGSGLTFAGSSGFTIATFTQPSTNAQTITLVNGVTYTITTALNIFQSRTSSMCSIVSNHASNKAILTLQQGATCNALANFTRIDASGGETIYTFNGVVTDSINVVSFGDPTLIAGLGGGGNFTFG